MEGFFLRYFKLIKDHLTKEERLLYSIVIFVGICTWKLIEYMPLPFNISANSFLERSILTSLMVVFFLIFVSIISLILKRWNFSIKLIVFMLIIELLLLYVAYEHYKIEPFPTKSNSLGIYIAELKGDKNNKRRKEIIQILNNTIREHNLQNRVEIKELNRIIYKSKKAKEMGKRGNARLVLWGNFPSKEKIHPYITVVRDYGLSKGEFTKFIIGSPSGVVCDLLKAEVPSVMIKEPYFLIMSTQS